VRVGVIHHRRFLGRVLDLAVAADFEPAPMPGIDGGFGAGEGVALFRREFGAEDLGRAGEELLRGEEDVSENVTIGGDGLRG